MNNSEKLLTTADIMKITTIGRTKLHKMEKTGEFPKADMQNRGFSNYPAGGQKHWRASTVRNWMQQKANSRGKK
ncbi:helix-turn-helix transcriptional regulator [Thiolapillus sp.]|uniref:helix-turn-helix transcriptional regulator n=1 Tax=Thiolapillus sp. TaxID=2017437 RepID=UPI003AF5691D